MPPWERRRREAALGVRLERCGSAVVLHLEGRLAVDSDLHWLKCQIRRIAREGARAIVLNFKGVRDLDCRGIGLLLFVRARVCRQGGVLALASVERWQKHLLQLAGLCAVFPMFDSGQEALDWCWRTLRRESWIPGVPFDYMAAAHSDSVAGASS